MGVTNRHMPRVAASAADWRKKEASRESAWTTKSGVSRSDASVPLRSCLASRHHLPKDAVLSYADEKASSDDEKPSDPKEEPSQQPKYKLYCPAGHTLEEHRAELASVCASCASECLKGTRLGSCRQCDFDLCDDCLDSRRRHLEEKKTEADTEQPQIEEEVKKSEVGTDEQTREPTLVEEETPPDVVHNCEQPSDSVQATGCLDQQQQQHQMVFFWPEPMPYAWVFPVAMLSPPAVDWDPTSQESTWEFPPPMDAFSPGLLDGAMQFDWGAIVAPCESAREDFSFAETQDTVAVDVKVSGDETMEGPDGHMYEVFYPECCSPENLLAEVETTVPDSHETSPRNLSTSSSASSAGEGCGSQQVPMLPEEPQECLCAHSNTAAEQWIEDIMHFMCSLSYERYPSRVRLFEMVQGAVTTALGDSFERLALVGSTALRIDTPDSDLDAVAFTRQVSKSEEASKPPMPAEALHWIAMVLAGFDATLNLQLVDCTRVPVLTVSTCDGQLSLDLTVDQHLSESHVLWYQSQQAEPWRAPAPLHSVPPPLLLGWEQGLDSAALRCVKWWLRRRRLPVGKEGGYPTFVWTLMVIYVLRCSLLVKESSCSICGCSNDKAPSPTSPRTLLGAIAAFFDRFADGGLQGRLFFRNGSAVFQDCAQAGIELGEFSVFDPTTTDEINMASGASPVELAPQISMATKLLYAYELHRAECLTTAAIASEATAFAQQECNVLRRLFADIDEWQNALPATLSEHTLTGVYVVCAGQLHLGLLQEIQPKPGWTATFLHRADDRSDLWAQICTVDRYTGLVTPVPLEEGSGMWFHPCDFVCQAFLNVEACPEQGYTSMRLEGEALERWFDMNAILGNHVRPTAGDIASGGHAPKQSSKGRKKASKRLKREW
mmetsp:Transcript_22769/g.51985  ORF Transcript_22769/g.51985 Transcript_22769/m.51985 type:complete len:891 (+) Transcript_22769:110-2782(+)